MKGTQNFPRGTIGKILLRGFDMIRKKSAACSLKSVQSPLTGSGFEMDGSGMIRDTAVQTVGICTRRYRDRKRSVMPAITTNRHGIPNVTGTELHARPVLILPHLSLTPRRILL